MRRLVVVSLLLVLGGLALLLPTSALYNLLTTGSASGEAALQQSLNPDQTDTVESVIGFGMIGLGAILEFFSLFTEVGGSAASSPSRSGNVARNLPVETKGDEQP